jgi:hypothetical protein
LQRRLQDRIQKLCSELLVQQDEKETQKLSGELRSKLRTYVEGLRRQFAAYPGVQAYRRKTDAVLNAPPVPTVPAAMAPSPVIHNEPEATTEASDDENGPSKMKAS